MKKIVLTLTFLISLPFIGINYQSAFCSEDLLDSYDTSNIAEIPICESVKSEIFNQKSSNFHEETIPAFNENTETSDETISKVFYIPEIPLSRNLQEYTYDLCSNYNINYNLVLAIISKESDFDSSAYGYNEDGSFDTGLMQINSCNISNLFNYFGITDLEDPYSNIYAGITILSDNIETLGEYDGVMAYNLGIGGYYDCIENEIYSTQYVETVFENKEEIESLPHYT